MRLRAAVVGAVALLAGCGGGQVVVLGDGSGASGTRIVECGSSVYDAAALASAPGVASLPDGPAGAVDDAGQPAFDPSKDWKVVHQSDDRVDLVRELDEPFDNGGGDIRTHESRVLEQVSATNVPAGTWLLTSAGPCAQRVAMPEDLGQADVTLAREPSPEDVTVHLFVHERACASGRDAEGRIELMELTGTEDQVQLRIGVRPRPGGQNCQGNPPTPFTVELTEPIGDRQIVDASVVPPRPVTLEAGG